MEKGVFSSSYGTKPTTRVSGFWKGWGCFSQKPQSHPVSPWPLPASSRPLPCNPRTPGMRNITASRSHAKNNLVLSWSKGYDAPNRKPWGRGGISKAKMSAPSLPPRTLCHLHQLSCVHLPWDPHHLLFPLIGTGGFLQSPLHLCFYISF